MRTSVEMTPIEGPSEKVILNHYQAWFAAPDDQKPNFFALVREMAEEGEKAEQVAAIAIADMFFANLRFKNADSFNHLVEVTLPFFSEHNEKAKIFYHKALRGLWRESVYLDGVTNSLEDAIKFVTEQTKNELSKTFLVHCYLVVGQIHARTAPFLKTIKSMDLQNKKLREAMRAYLAAVSLMLSENLSITIPLQYLCGLTPDILKAKNIELVSSQLKYLLDLLDGAVSCGNVADMGLLCDTLYLFKDYADLSIDIVDRVVGIALEVKTARAREQLVDFICQFQQTINEYREHGGSQHRLLGKDRFKKSKLDRAPVRRLGVSLDAASRSLSHPFVYLADYYAQIADVDREKAHSYRKLALQFTISKLPKSLEEFVAEVMPDVNRLVGDIADRINQKEACEAVFDLLKLASHHFGVPSDFQERKRSVIEQKQPEFYPVQHVLKTQSIKPFVKLLRHYDVSKNVDEDKLKQLESVTYQLAENQFHKAQERLLSGVILDSQQLKKDLENAYSGDESALKEDANADKILALIKMAKKYRSQHVGEIISKSISGDLVEMKNSTEIEVNSEVIAAFYYLKVLLLLKNIQQATDDYLLVESKCDKLFGDIIEEAITFINDCMHSYEAFAVFAFKLQLNSNLDKVMQLNPHTDEVIMAALLASAAAKKTKAGKEFILWNSNMFHMLARNNLFTDKISKTSGALLKSIAALLDAAPEYKGFMLHESKSSGSLQYQRKVSVTTVSAVGRAAPLRPLSNSSQPVRHSMSLDGR